MERSGWNTTRLREPQDGVVVVESKRLDDIQRMYTKNSACTKTIQNNSYIDGDTYAWRYMHIYLYMFCFDCSFASFFRFHM